MKKNSVKTNKVANTATVNKLRSGIYRLRIGDGQSFQIETNRKGADVFKFSKTARHFRFVGEAANLTEAETQIRSGKYRKIFQVK